MSQNQSMTPSLNLSPNLSQNAPQKDESPRPHPLSEQNVLARIDRKGDSL